MAELFPILSMTSLTWWFRLWPSFIADSITDWEAWEKAFDCLLGREVARKSMQKMLECYY